jgi:hypothetical protein
VCGARDGDGGARCSVAAGMWGPRGGVKQIRLPTWIVTKLRFLDWDTDLCLHVLNSIVFTVTF